MKKIILNILNDSIKVKDKSIKQNIDIITEAVDFIAKCIKHGNKILIFGNGGSASDAQHIAAEFVNRFEINRPPLAAIALTTDTSVITSIGNDFGFDQIFAKQIKALASKGDLAWGLSTSGNSPNIIKAVKAAKEIGIFTIGMTGQGGELAKYSDLVLRVESKVTARIQETHIIMAHILCDLVDRILFKNKN